MNTEFRLETTKTLYHDNDDLELRKLEKLGFSFINEGCWHLQKKEPLPEKDFETVQQLQDLSKKWPAGITIQNETIIINNGQNEHSEEALILNGHY